MTIQAVAWLTVPLGSADGRRPRAARDEGAPNAEYFCGGEWRLLRWWLHRLSNLRTLGSLLKRAHFVNRAQYSRRVRLTCSRWQYCSGTGSGVARRAKPSVWNIRPPRRDALRRIWRRSLPSRMCGGGSLRFPRRVPPHGDVAGVLRLETQR
jgi:hypothetical protein